jgi:hypothetical protein
LPPVENAISRWQVKKYNEGNEFAVLANIIHKEWADK